MIKQYRILDSEHNRMGTAQEAGRITSITWDGDSEAMFYLCPVSDLPFTVTGSITAKKA